MSALFDACRHGGASTPAKSNSGRVRALKGIGAGTDGGSLVASAAGDAESLMQRLFSQNLLRWRGADKLCYTGKYVRDFLDALLDGLPDPDFGIAARPGVVP
jgi:hypothetical protein